MKFSTMLEREKGCYKQGLKHGFYAGILLILLILLVIYDVFVYISRL